MADLAGVAAAYAADASAPCDVNALLADTLGTLNSHSDNSELERALRSFAVRAAALDPLWREIARRAAVDVLQKDFRLRGAGRLVDAAFPNGKRESVAEPPGQAVMFDDPEPWPEPVDGADVLDEIYTTVLRFVAMPIAAAVAVSLWVMLAHMHDAFDVSPLLILKSPEKRCGKTRSLTIVAALVPRALPTVNITVAALFRAIEKFRPTLLIDEADAFLKDRGEELRGLLNSGHHRPGAVVVRTVGDDFEARTFSTWAAKAIALIGDLPPTLEDRGVVVSMRRRAPDEEIERLRLDRLKELEPIRRRAARWAADNMAALRQADPIVPGSLDDRAADNWRALLAIADIAGWVWPEKAREAALSLAGFADEAETAPSIQLLADIRGLFRERQVDRLPSGEIVADLAGREDRPWPEWRGGRPITSRQIARLLARFRIRPRVIRTEEGTARGYVLSQFSDVFARYLPSDPQQPQHPRKDAASRGFSTCNGEEPVADSKTGDLLGGMRDVADVADQNRGSGEREI